MSRKENLFTTTLRLNLNNAQDYEAWNNLISADTRQPEYSSYSRTIVTALNDHFNRLDHPDKKENEDGLLKRIEQTIRETVADSLKEFRITAAALATHEPDLPSESKLQDENEETINAFLDCF